MAAVRGHTNVVLRWAARATSLYARASCFRRTARWLAEMHACPCFLAGASDFGETCFGGEPTTPIIHAYPIPAANTGPPALFIPRAALYCVLVALQGLVGSRSGSRPLKRAIGTGGSVHGLATGVRAEARMDL